MLRVSRLAILGGGLVLLYLITTLFLSSSSSSTRSVPTQPFQPISKPQPASHKRPSWHASVSSSSGATTFSIDRLGLTHFDTTSSSAQKHPIEQLIERGKHLAAVLEGRINEVHNLDHAVEEYERGFGMAPPKGFERWFMFTQSGEGKPSVPVAPLFPMVHEPFVQYLAHPADVLRERAKELRDKAARYSLTLVELGKGDPGTECEAGQDWFPNDWSTRGRGRVLVQGDGAWQWRCNNTLMMLLPIIPLLPPEIFTQKPALEITFSYSDGPEQQVHNNFRERSEALANAGKTWSKAQLTAIQNTMAYTWGWQWTCPEGTPLKVEHNDYVLNDHVQQVFNGEKGAGSRLDKSFIADADMSADFCQNPALMSIHNLLLLDKSRAGDNLKPIVSLCRTMWSSDLLGVPLDGAWEQPDYIPWEEKTDARAFWRGSATGLFHAVDNAWRDSQRERLHWFAQNKSSATQPVLLDRSGLVEVAELEVKTMNEKWLDVGLSGQPVQCSPEACEQMAKEIDFMPRVTKESQLKYKFQMDVDGNGWSSRFRRLLAGNSVILKSTIYPEWFNQILIPWYHYVPVKLDYSDLYDIMAFFAGSPDGTSPGRDDLAKEIATNGLQFTEERWRERDMQSYMFLFILEYWRMMSDDREAASFQS